MSTLHRPIGTPLILYLGRRILRRWRKGRYRNESWGQTFHEPKLICTLNKVHAGLWAPGTWKVRRHESIKERLVQFDTAQLFFSPSLAGNFAFGATLERLWIRHRTFHVSNLMHTLFYVFCELFDRNEHFSPFELSSAEIKIGASESNQLV